MRTCYHSRAVIITLSLLVLFAVALFFVKEPLPPVQAQSPIHFTYLPLVGQRLDCPTAPLPPVDWDPRLGPGGLPLLENVRLVPAAVAACETYWRIVRVRFEDIDESGNDHTIYVKVLDETGNRASGVPMHLTSVGGLSEYPAEKLAGDLCDCNYDYPMFGDGYAVQLDAGIPSDKVEGMIMPMQRHVNYRITFQRTRMPQSP